MLVLNKLSNFQHWNITHHLNLALLFYITDH
jgi:hypothetical protein